MMAGKIQETQVQKDFLFYLTRASKKKKKKKTFTSRKPLSPLTPLFSPQAQSEGSHGAVVDVDGSVVSS